MHSGDPTIRQIGSTAPHGPNESFFTKMRKRVDKELPDTPRRAHTTEPTTEGDNAVSSADLPRATSAGSLDSLKQLEDMRETPVPPPASDPTSVTNVRHEAVQLSLQESAVHNDGESPRSPGSVHLVRASRPVEVPVIRKKSSTFMKRNVRATKAMPLADMALPSVLQRSSSLRKKSTRPPALQTPERSASFTMMPNLSIEKMSAAMHRTPSEPLLESIALSTCYSTDSETFGSSSFATSSSRTSVSGTYDRSARMSRASSSFTYATDCSPPQTPEEAANSHEGGSDQDHGLHEVGLGISADVAVDPVHNEAEEETSLESGGRLRSRSRTSSAAAERIRYSLHRWSGRPSSVVYSQKTTQCSAGADVSDLFVPVETTHLILADASQGVEGLLDRVLPAIAPELLVLDLSRANLRSLPSSIARCEKLTELVLAGNKFAGGMMPALLTTLQSLEVLVLDNCHLSLMTTSLAPLKRLHTLSICQNAIRSLPSWIAQLPALRTLRVDGNPFTPHWTSLVQPLLNDGSTNSMRSTRSSSVTEPSPSSSSTPGDFLVIRSPLPKKQRSMVDLGLPRSSFGDAASRRLPSQPSAASSIQAAVIDPTADIRVRDACSDAELPPGEAGAEYSPSPKRKGIFGSLRKGQRSHKPWPDQPEADESRSQRLQDDTSKPRPFASNLWRSRTISTHSTSSDSAQISPGSRRRKRLPLTSMSRQASQNRLSSNEKPLDETEPSMLPLASLDLVPGMPAVSSGSAEKDVVRDGDTKALLASVNTETGFRMLLAYLQDLDDLNARHTRLISPKIRTTELSGSPLTQADSLNNLCLTSKGLTKRSKASLVEREGRSITQGIKLKDDVLKRQRVIAEILSTERSYIKGLDDLVEIYVRPAAEKSGELPLVPPSERKAVFGNVENILHFHSSVLLPDLEAAAAPLLENTTGVDAVPLDSSHLDVLSRAVAEAIAKVFSRHVAYLKIYSDYITGFDDALSRFQSWTMSSDGIFKTPSSAKLGNATSASSSAEGPAQLSTSQRKKMKAYLKQCRSHPRHTQISCESYMLLPIQRLPRYKMLFESLYACTTEQAGSRQALLPSQPVAAALEAASALATEMNERKRESEGRKNLLVWQHRLGTARFRSPLVQPHRWLLREGCMTLSRVVKRSTTYAEPNVSPSISLDSAEQASLVQVSSLQIKSDVKPLIALLCSDILVFVHDSEPSASSVELYTVFRPCGEHATPASVFGGEGMLRIVDSRAILYLRCSSDADAHAWADAINLQLSPS